ncbi:branched-chain amino acid ABC transporter permease [Bordetella sputigena]|uniref:branched-chain amino acid ABC transporter permease n=1 Tax=Bordetella sputigena TaxID=1416810 RepID=UPI0039EF1454
MADTIALPRAANQRTRMRPGLAMAFVVLALAGGLAGWLTDNVFYLRLATEALIFGGLAMAVDLLLGIAGLLSLGQALFFGFGAYLAGLLLRDAGFSFWPMLVVVAASGALAGLVAGVIAIRARGVYFALITFGLAQIAAKAVYNIQALGASDGLMGVPVVAVGMGPWEVPASDPLGFFLVVLAIVMIMYGVLSYLLNTPFGRNMQALRANPQRLSFLGFDPWRYKLAAFVIAAVLAAVAGALYPVLRGFASPELLYFQTSGNAVITVVLGGVGTLIGALYGSVILFGLKSIIGTYTEHHLIVIGLLFMIAVIFFPAGLVGALRRRK